MITKEQLRELKLAELMRMKDEIDNVIQERAKSSGMVLASIAAHTSSDHIRAVVKSPNDEESEAWPFG